jgi:SAM-dependent methyltransferase
MIRLAQVEKVIPARLKRILKKGRTYKAITLSDADIRSGKYKSLLGGGAAEWGTRGEFQLVFLRQMGLQDGHRLLDVGCGPLRAGEHFIRALGTGGYCGIDDNKDFVKVAKQIVAGHEDLLTKNPRIEHVTGFDFERLGERFDYVMVFSVLNHCTDDERKAFFSNIGHIAKDTTKIYITHAKWFDMSLLAGSGLTLARKLKDLSEVFPAPFSLDDWGWRDGESRYLFPILELQTATSR